MNNHIDKGYVTFYNGIICIHDYQYYSYMWHEDITIKTDGDGITVTATQRQMVDNEDIRSYKDYPESFEEVPYKVPYKLFGFIPMLRWAKSRWLLKARKKQTWHSKTWEFEERLNVTTDT